MWNPPGSTSVSNKSSNITNKPAIQYVQKDSCQEKNQQQQLYNLRRSLDKCIVYLFIDEGEYFGRSVKGENVIVLERMTTEITEKIFSSSEADLLIHVHSLIPFI